MGVLNDKMTALADKIREKHMVYPYKMNIDKMIELVDELHFWQQAFDGSAQPGDVSAGHTFYSDSFDLKTGTMPDTAASVDKDTVTIPAGRIRAEQVITIPAGSVSISEDNSKVIVTEGYVQDEEIPLPGGASFYKCAAVHGPRKVSGFIVSGAGTAAVNGNYLQTDLTTEEGSIIYKHETAEYYYFEMWGEKGICTSPTDYPGNGLYYNMYDEGWYPGSSGAEPAPTVTAGNIIIDANVPKTWDGYKVQKNSSGAFSVSGTLTEGLVYSRLTPAVGRVYSEDGLVKSSYFRQSRSGELLMIPLVSDEWKADTGQELTVVDDARLDCESFRFGRRASDVSAPLSYNGNTLTVTTWIKTSSSAILFSLRNESMEINFEYYSNKVVAVTGEDGAEVYAPEGIEMGAMGDRWAHFSVVLLPDKIKVYVNAKYWGETELYASAKNKIYTSAHVHTTYRGLSDAPHWVKDFRVYNRELSAAEISEIRKENDPEK